MSFKFKKKLPVPKEIKELYPVSSALAAQKKELDQQIIDVITGKSDKFLAIIGPCSADNEASVCEYIERLVKVQEKCRDGGLKFAVMERMKILKNMMRNSAMPFYRR